MEISTTHSHKSTIGTEVTHAALYGVGEMKVKCTMQNSKLLKNTNPVDTHVS
jgi:endonuclease III